MNTPIEIYRAYKIMPFLQTHQLRVAAVGKSIADALERTIDTRNIVIACLFHDMGNILKTEFHRFPESLQPEGEAYWQGVKDDFTRRYGENEHHATIEIAHELHLPLQALQYIDSVGFSKLEKVRDGHSFEQKIVEYADLRVAPLGVASMEERLAEAKKRYEHRPVAVRDWEDGQYERLVGAAKEIEQQIFAEARIGPDEITETSVQPLIAELRNFQLG